MESELNNQEEARIGCVGAEGEQKLMSGRWGVWAQGKALMFRRRKARAEGPKCTPGYSFLVFLKPSSNLRMSQSNLDRLRGMRDCSRRALILPDPRVDLMFCATQVFKFLRRLQKCIE
jgi:hypothetical protein